MKNILIIIFCLNLALCSNAQTITGGVEYNTNSAREALLSSQIPTIPNNLLKSNIFDQNTSNNKALLLKGCTETQTSILAKFSDGSYAIAYKNNPKYTWYYSQDGILTHSEVKTSATPPFKAYKYNTSGKLINMNLRPSKDESFIFNPSGKLIAHWIKDTCYDENGNIIMKREYSNF